MLLQGMGTGCRPGRAAPPAAQSPAQGGLGAGCGRAQRRRAAVAPANGEGAGGVATAVAPAAPPALAAINVAVVEPPPVQPPPEPLAVMHSGAFMRQRRGLPAVSVTSSLDESAAPRRGAAADNALLWALQKVDRQLDQIEADPPKLLKDAYGVANGPVGAATGRGVQAAARLTVAATSRAVKAAAPVGSWALREGFKAASKAAVGLVALAMEQQQAAEKQQQQQQQARGKK
ncbi:MAG: hypothetical protein J3K34DRAFT_526998 [Monoraphidium minutum]|nr:MAG: hypothetical protein J3K34DRAFT_526998 [Monoraphidium minutum]